MVLGLFNKNSKHKVLTFERVYSAPIDKVWQAWTDPEQVKQWWGPEGVLVPECIIDLRVGGQVRIVMEAGESMGKYQGTRWPLDGTFTEINAPHSFSYEAKSWTEGEEDKSTIDQINTLKLTADGESTKMLFTVTIVKVGPGAKMAAFGMKFGYKAQFDKLSKLLDK